MWDTCGCEIGSSATRRCKRDASDSTTSLFWNGERAFVPARLSDNPALEAESYRDSLAVLPPVVREQMLNGDWSVREQGIFQAPWLRYFRCAGGQIELLDGAGRIFTVIPAGNLRRFATVDPAGTSADKAREQRGRAASWSVIQVWEQPWGEQSKYLLLRHQWRERVGFDGLCHALRMVHERVATRANLYRK